MKMPWRAVSAAFAALLLIALATLLGPTEPRPGPPSVHGTATMPPAARSDAPADSQRPRRRLARSAHADPTAGADSAILQIEQISPPTISGRVVDDLGVPVPGVRVRASSVLVWHRTFITRAHASRSISLSHNRTATPSKSPETPENDPHPSSSTPEYFHVSKSAWKILEPDPQQWTPLCFAGGDPAETVTDGEGYFHLEGLPRVTTSDLGLEFDHPDYEPTKRRLHLSGSRRSVELPPTKLRRGGRIRGLVTRKDGSAVASVRVEAQLLTDEDGLPERSDGSTPRTTQVVATGKGGQFAFGGLESGTYRLELLGGRLACRRPHVRVDTFGVRLIARRAKPLGGHVVDGHGLPIAGARVSVTDVIDGTVDDDGKVPHAWYTAVTNDQGRFEAAGLAAGSRFLVVVTASGWGTTVFQGVSASREPREFVLSPPASVAGLVLGADGEPPACRRVEIEVKSTLTGQVATGDADGNGTFRVDGLPPAPLELLVEREYGPIRGSGSSSSITYAPIPVAPGDGNVRVHLPAGLPLAGVVLDSKDRPDGGALVEVSDEKGNVGSTTTGPDGKFALQDIPPGRYRLLVETFRERQTEANGTIWCESESFDQSVRAGDTHVSIRERSDR